MAWRLSHVEHCTYERNLLSTVLFEVRFQPILKVAAKVPDFQERIRARFPVYEQVETTTIQLPGLPLGFVLQSTEKRYQFKAEDGGIVVGLGASSMSLENHRHKSRRAFFDDVALAVDALRETYDPVLPLRIGLRYINEIPIAKLGHELGRAVTPTEVLAPEFLRWPNELHLDEAVAATELRAPVDQGAGSLTLRYAINQSPDGPICRLDMDRYLEGATDLSILRETLLGLSDDIFSLFSAARGPALSEWMGAARPEETQR